MKTKIVFEDKDILVVYKPAGIATQTSKVSEPDVVSELKNYLKGGFVGVIHRLDQPVEGLLVFAKNQATAAYLSGLVKEKGSGEQENCFNKDYLAVVYGEPAEKEARLENMMLKNPNRTAEIISNDVADKYQEAKKAVLRYECVGVKEVEMDGIYGTCQYTISLIRVHLETGRFHQIRAQLAHIGYPIVGDKKYGTTESIQCADAMKVRSVALCADHLAFKNKEGKLCEYEHKPLGKIFELLYV